MEKRMEYFEMIFKNDLSMINENINTIAELSSTDIEMLLKSTYTFKKKEIFA